MLCWKVLRRVGTFAWLGILVTAGAAFAPVRPAEHPGLAVAAPVGGPWALVFSLIGLGGLVLGGICWWRGRRLERRLKQQALDSHLEEARHRALFDNTPVQILEEDLSAVAAAFAPLRSQGVSSLGIYFSAHPERPREWLRLARLVDANQPAVAAAGCANKAELIARFPRLDAPPNQEIFGHQLAQLWAGARLFEEELRYLDAQGHERACLVRSRVNERDGRPDPARVVLVMLDITTAKRTVAAQMENQELLRQILGHANILLWWAQVRKEDGRFRWKINVPSQAYDSPIFKLATAMDQGGLWEIEHAPDLAETAQRADQALLSGRPGYQQEFRVISREGVTHWLSEDVGISRLGENEWSFVGVVTDVTARHQAEDERKKSQAQLQQILSRADCMLWQARVTDDAGRFVWQFEAPASGLQKRIFGGASGITRDGVTGDSRKSLYAGFTVPEMAAMDARSSAAMRSNAPGYEQEFQLIKGDETFWLHERTAITPVGPGQWDLVGVIVDVTAQKTAEVARKTTEAQLQQILTRADCLIWEARVVREGDGLRWHHCTMPGSVLCDRVFGAKPPTTGTGLWYGADTPDLAEMSRLSTEAVFSGAPGYEQEFRVLRPQGTLWLHEQVSIRAVEPDQWDLVGVLMDVTAKREAEEARRTTEARLQETLNRADCLLWQAHVVESAAGALDWALYIPPSSLYRELFGGDPSKHSNFMWAQLNVPDLPEMTRRAREAILKDAPGYEQEFSVLIPGRTFWLREQVTITPVGRGQWNLVGIIINVTARREAEEARKASEAQLQEILTRADCLLWQARVTETDGQMVWQFNVLASGLKQRVFGGEGAINTSALYDGLTVPELPEMNVRAAHALHGGAPGYEQEFRIVKPDCTHWLHERVSITPQGPGQWQLVGVIIDISAVKEAEQAIRASETRYRDLFTNAVEGVYQSTAEGRIVSVNPSLAQIFGCVSPDEFMTWTGAGAVSLYVKPGRRAEFFAELGARDAVTEFESEVRCRDGTTKWISENVRAVRDAKGRLLRVQGFLTDVTERRKALEGLRESEGRYRALFENIPVAIMELDLRGFGRQLQIIRAAEVKDLSAYLAAHPEEMAALKAQVRIAGTNDAAMRLYRAESKEQFQCGFERLIAGDTQWGMQKFLETVWQGRNSGEAEVDVADFAGEKHDVYLRWWMPLPEERLKVTLAVVALVDLTELKRAEAELAVEKERLTVTLHAMLEGVITTDTEGVVQYMNRAAAELTQQDAQAAVGRPLAEICVLQEAATSQILTLPVTRVLAEGALVDLSPQTALVGRNGATCLVEGCCVPVRDADSRLIGTVLVLRDVTVRQRFEEELQRASRLESVGILAGGIAHDFNNILTAIMGNITLALLDAEALTKTERYLRDAERAALRARDLTQQLLTFSKGGDPVRSAVQLPEIVTEVARFALHGSRVKCEYDLPAGLWLADADKGQLGQVVQNLVINAVQAMPGGGTIRISARNETVTLDPRRPLAAGDYVHISVADNGTGIKPEHVVKIFDPYFTTKEQGSGLGLTTVYSIIKKHNGHIEVESELGRGTTFQIWLPALCERQLAFPEAGPVASTQLKGRVLFMDDEEPINMMASMLLERLGLEVELARDGAETIQKFQAAHTAGRPFDLVVMDLTVPGGMGGREAIGELHRIDPRVKAIVSSGYSSDPVMANFRAYGFCGVVAKPYRIDDFARVLRDVLRESRPPMSGSRFPVAGGS